MKSRSGSWILMAVVLAFTALRAFAQDPPMTRSERERARNEQAARDALLVPASMDAEAAFKLAAAKEAERNFGDAVRIYRIAAQSGSGKAARRLWEIYDRGVVAVSPDYRESMLWYQHALDLGEKFPDLEAARAKLARQRDADIEFKRQAADGTPRPGTRAEREAQRDAEAAARAIGKPAGQVPALSPSAEVPSAPVATAGVSETEAMYQQALAMENSGKAADAVRIYRRAARASHGKAALRLGAIFDCGMPGVPRDQAESLQWYQTARNLGETIAIPRSC